MNDSHAFLAINSGIRHNFRHRESQHPEEDPESEDSESESDEDDDDEEIDRPVDEARLRAEVMVKRDQVYMNIVPVIIPFSVSNTPHLNITCSQIIILCFVQIASTYF